MHADGWIPREQILGAEAEARVPAEFLAQHRQHANPPALLLRLHSLVRATEAGAAAAGGGGAAADAAAIERRLALLSELWPRLVQWHAWFLRTQAGEVAGSFRWRGRDPNDKKLNAMTLSSGLDDYPRATSVSSVERHVDLHCWVAFFTRLLATLADRLAKPDEAASYARQFDEQLEALLALHWNAKAAAFHDWGFHANQGDFRPFYVVKCATSDGREQLEADVADPNRPDCPRSHPRFLFPLGDGKGALSPSSNRRSAWSSNRLSAARAPPKRRRVPPGAAGCRRVPPSAATIATDTDRHRSEY